VSDEAQDLLTAEFSTFLDHHAKEFRGSRICLNDQLKNDWPASEHVLCGYRQCSTDSEISRSGQTPHSSKHCIWSCICRSRLCSHWTRFIYSASIFNEVPAIVCSVTEFCSSVYMSMVVIRQIFLCLIWCQFVIHCTRNPGSVTFFVSPRTLRSKRSEEEYMRLVQYWGLTDNRPLFLEESSWKNFKHHISITVPDRRMCWGITRQIATSSIDHYWKFFPLGS